MVESPCTLIDLERHMAYWATPPVKVKTILHSRLRYRSMTADSLAYMPYQVQVIYAHIPDIPDIPVAFVITIRLGIKPAVV